MVELLTTYGVTSIIIILLIAIPTIVNFISWCKKLWKQRQAFAQENEQKGYQEGVEAEEEQFEKNKFEERIKKMESDIVDLKVIVSQQKELIKQLTESDMLNTKAWIKEQHEKWIALQCIDSQSLDLILQRYKIYAKEGGNGWAQKMVEEIKALPTITVIPVPRD